VLSYLELHSYLLYYLERSWLKIDPTLYKWRGIPLGYGVYADDLDPEWTQAWAVTEKVLALTRQSVEADGAKFALIVEPDSYVTDPQWREKMVKSEGQVPAGFDPPLFFERLNQISAQAGVTVMSLIPYMQAYSAEHHLQPPYFSFPCDPHYSPMGHQVIADALVQELKKDNLLPPPSGGPQ
jgi:hypothetical protein